MLNIIGSISNRNIITKNSSILVNFDVLNMFPSIDNVLDLEAVSRTLNNRESPAECILDALKLCLECNNSIFKDHFYLHVDDTAMGPPMSCSNSDIAIYWHSDIVT